MAIMTGDQVVVELRRRLAEAEGGTNEHGVYWVSAKLVETMRWFYAVTNDTYDASADPPPSRSPRQ